MVLWDRFGPVSIHAPRDKSSWPSFGCPQIKWPYRDSHAEVANRDRDRALENTLESKYWNLLITSFLVALGAALGPGILNLRSARGFVLIGIPLSIAWCLIVVYAFQQFKLRALWFLLGAPIALRWPLAIALISLGLVRM